MSLGRRERRTTISFPCQGRPSPICGVGGRQPRPLVNLGLISVVVVDHLPRFSFPMTSLNACIDRTPNAGTNFPSSWPPHSTATLRARHILPRKQTVRPIARSRFARRVRPPSTPLVAPAASAYTGITCPENLLPAVKKLRYRPKSTLQYLPKPAFRARPRNQTASSCWQARLRASSYP